MITVVREKLICLIVFAIPLAGTQEAVRADGDRCQGQVHPACPITENIWNQLFPC